jgi:hypothetical protein
MDGLIMAHASLNARMKSVDMITPTAQLTVKIIAKHSRLMTEYVILSARIQKSANLMEMTVNQYLTVLQDVVDSCEEIKLAIQNAW